MIQMKVDTNSSLYATNEVNTTAQAAVKSDVAKSQIETPKSVDINMHEQDLIAVAEAELKQQPAVDFDFVNQIKDQITNGELTFDMGELARTLAKLD